MLAPPTPPAPTHHPTVIVPAPTLTQHPHHHVTVVTMSPSVHTSTVSTSRQNLDTIVQVCVSLSPCWDSSESQVILKLSFYWNHCCNLQCCSSSPLRPSSTSSALRRGEPVLRRSRGERSLLAPPMSPWKPPAQTQTLTQRERTAQWTDPPHELTYTHKHLTYLLTVRFPPGAWLLLKWICLWHYPNS